MAWPFAKRRFQRGAEAGQVQAGRHASPGLQLLAEGWQRRRPDTVLDLGPTSTESLAFLTSRAEHVEVWDLYQSSGGIAPQDRTPRGARGSLFQFEPERLDLPDSPHDVILAWDLLHYFRPADRIHFGRALGAAATEGSLLHLVASNIAKIPATPIHFKILSPRPGLSGKEYPVEYVLASEPEVPSPGLHTRQVEMALPDFRPIRHFQLRNGLQELIFQRSALS